MDIALNTISDEPILMNQIFVELISMNQIYVERGLTKSVCSSLVHLSNSDSTYLLHHIILSHSIFTYLIYHNFFLIPFLRICLTNASFHATYLRIYSTINILSHPGQNHFYVSTQHMYSFVSSTFHSTYRLDRKYSFSPWTKPFLRTYSTHLFFCILDIPFYVSTRPYDMLAHPWQTISMYLLNTYIVSYPRISFSSYLLNHKYSFSPWTKPCLRIYSTLW